MINQIRKFLIQHDPTIQALKPQVSENLHKPLETPKTYGASTKDLRSPGADSSQTTEQ